jgi:hypothetical protein
MTGSDVQALHVDEERAPILQSLPLIGAAASDVDRGPVRYDRRAQWSGMA